VESGAKVGGSNGRECDKSGVDSLADSNYRIPLTHSHVALNWI